MAVVLGRRRIDVECGDRVLDRGTAEQHVGNRLATARIRVRCFDDSGRFVIQGMTTELPVSSTTIATMTSL